MSEATTKYDRYPFVKELERIFGIFNSNLFGNQLILPTHIVQPEIKTVFRFVPESEVMIIGGKFSNVSITEMLEFYLHEMLHIANRDEGIIDVGANQYHNKHFLWSALRIGFFVYQHKVQNWSITKFQKIKNKEGKNPNADDHALLVDVLEILKLDEELIQEGQTELDRIVTSSVPARVSFLKYICECEPPYNSIRSGRRPDGEHPLKIQCVECGAIFVPEEGSFESPEDD